jgi:hypothetical protein
MVSVGWAFMRQSLELPEAQTTEPQALITAVGGRGSWPLGGGFTLEASLELMNLYLRRQENREGIESDAPRFGTLTYRTGVGVGYRY